MLQLTKGQTQEQIIVTLNELVTLTTPYFLFVFTQVTTRQVVTLIKSSDDDASDYPERYNQFEINTQALFGSMQAGEWIYRVYEQESDTNTDPAGLNEVENGKLRLYPAANFNYTQYNTPTTYKAYNG